MELADRTAGWALAEAGAGRLAPRDYLEACLDRVAAREGEVRALVSFDAEAARRAADSAAGPLTGLPLGVKDVFDTADFPTAYGSPVYEGHRPAHDAAAVALAKAAGCVLPGKTVTTEFAYFHPGPTANPRNPAHTPGGSSSGSAAAVGAGMVPFALGTQTAGSVIRPAAFCGVVGLKAGHGRLPLDGVKPLAPALDSLRCFARSVADCALWFAAVSGETQAPSREAPPRIGLVRTPSWEAARPETRDPRGGRGDPARAAGRGARGGRGRAPRWSGCSRAPTSCSPPPRRSRRRRGSRAPASRSSTGPGRCYAARA